MAGPTPMALGPFAFEGLGFGFDKISRKLNTEWATVATAGGFDAQQWLGPKSEEIKISGAVFEKEFGGQSSLDGVRGAALSGTPLMLAKLSGSIVGFMTIQGVDEAEDYIDANGVARKNVYSIRLRRYRGIVFNPMSVLVGLF